MLFLAVFEAPRGKKSPKRRENFHGCGYFVLAFLCIPRSDPSASTGRTESGAVRSSLRYPSPGGSMMRRSFSSVFCVAVALSAALIADQATQQGGGQRGTPPPTGTQPQGGRGGRGGVAIEPGQECPPGTTMTRYLRCTAPEWPVPSIVDYRPKSTLVTPEHPVPKAKYPAVDVHGHIAGNLDSAESLAAFVAKLDSIGVGVFISADRNIRRPAPAENRSRAQQPVQGSRSILHGSSRCRAWDLAGPKRPWRNWRPT